MSLRHGSLAIGLAAVVVSFSFASNDASACGGCFVSQVDAQSQSTVVTGHRMALSISMDRTVLWDQIQYAGDPAEFAWVLPIKPGAYLELANDAFFEALEAATAVKVRSPSIGCPQAGNTGNFEGGDYEGGGQGCNMFACGMSAAEGGGDWYAGGGGGGLNTGGGGAPPPDPVTVVHQESIGPYETVTIHSNIPGSLYTWLDSHGYAVDESIKPTIDDYETEGFDFIGLRLIPGANVKQMTPVRVVSPGATPVLPLRMVAAGTGANVAITLFVIGEGRWETQNFPNGTVPTGGMSWDFVSQSSNYAELRQQALALNEGQTWLTAYARGRALLSRLYGPQSAAPLDYYTSDGTQAETMAGLYLWQAATNGEDVDFECAAKIDFERPYALSSSKVVEACAQDGSGGAGAGGAGGGGAGAGGAGASAGAGGAGASAGAGGAGAGASGGAGGAGASAGSAGAGPGGGGAGGAPCVVGADEIPSSEFVCGTLDDVGVALVGMHPADVWVTRLEANLPQVALGQDLAMQAELSQYEQSNFLQANEVVNPPCDDWVYTGAPGAPTIGPGDKPRDRAPRREPPSNHTRDLTLFGVVFATLASALARRLARPSLRRARTAR